MPQGSLVEAFGWFPRIDARVAEFLSLPAMGTPMTVSNQGVCVHRVFDYDVSFLSHGAQRAALQRNSNLLLDAPTIQFQVPPRS